MAKKKPAARRVPRTPSARTYGDGQPTRAQEAVEEAVRTNGRPAAPAVRSFPSGRAMPNRFTESRASIPLTQEYHYVVNDLRRLGILAASVFAVLVVMGFIIR